MVSSGSKINAQANHRKSNVSLIKEEDLLAIQLQIIMIAQYRIS